MLNPFIFVHKFNLFLSEIGAVQKAEVYPPTSSLLGGDLGVKRQRKTFSTAPTTFRKSARNLPPQSVIC